MKEAYENGLLGRNVLGSGIDVDIYGALGAGAYICGEETALMESLEGKKGQPRYKPPFPANFGLYGKPTTINNTETYASVPAIIRNGAEWFATWASPTTAVRKCSRCPDTSTIPATSRSASARRSPTCCRWPGACVAGRKLKGVIPGGSSMPVLPAETMMSLTMDYDAIQKAGSGLGSGAVIVMDDTTCMVRACQRIARFYFKESCGQCTPCREGTGWMYRMLTRIVNREATLDDLHMLRAAAGQIEGHTSARSVRPRHGRCRASCATFWHEFEYAIVNKRFLVDDEAAGTVVQQVAA